MKFEIDVVDVDLIDPINYIVLMNFVDIVVHRIDCEDQKKTLDELLIVVAVVIDSSSQHHY